MREDLLDRLLHLHPLMRQRFDAVLPREQCASVAGELHGATLHQLEALRTLVHRGRVTMHELAALLGVGPSSATQMVDRLVSRELVERQPDPADRRLVWIIATPKAAQLSARFTDLKREVLRTLTAALSDGELATLVGLLVKLAGGPHVHASTREAPQ
jgi:DNA-binding MarR family transcriptional regulator